MTWLSWRGTEPSVLKVEMLSKACIGEVYFTASNGEKKQVLTFVTLLIFKELDPPRSAAVHRHLLFTLSLSR